MSADTSVTTPNTPSIERSVYEYSTGCSFKVLNSPNIELLIQMLQKHQDYVGFKDKIALLSDEGKVLLASTRLWDPFAKKIVIAVKVSITGEKAELGTMKKQLAAAKYLLLARKQNWVK